MKLFSTIINNRKLKPSLTFMLFVLVVVLLYLIYDKHNTTREGLLTLRARQGGVKKQKYKSPPTYDIPNPVSVSSFQLGSAPQVPSRTYKREPNLKGLGERMGNAPVIAASPQTTGTLTRSSIYESPNPYKQTPPPQGLDVFSLSKYGDDLGPQQLRHLEVPKWGELPSGGRISNPFNKPQTPPPQGLDDFSLSKYGGDLKGPQQLRRLEARNWGELPSGGRISNPFNRPQKSQITNNPDKVPISAVDAAIRSKNPNFKPPTGPGRTSSGGIISGKLGKPIGKPVVGTLEPPQSTIRSSKYGTGFVRRQEFNNPIPENRRKILQAKLRARQQPSPRRNRNNNPPLTTRTYITPEGRKIEAVGGEGYQIVGKRVMKPSGGVYDVIPGTGM